MYGTDRWIYFDKVRGTFSGGLSSAGGKRPYPYYFAKANDTNRLEVGVIYLMDIYTSFDECSGFANVMYGEKYGTPASIVFEFDNTKGTVKKISSKSSFYYENDCPTTYSTRNCRRNGKHYIVPENFITYSNTSICIKPITLPPLPRPIVEKTACIRWSWD